MSHTKIDIGLAQPYRLEQGGQIDRSQPLQFSFNGRNYSGFQGDTLASALLANNVKMLARSFKYHRPRGIFTAGEEEPCALVEIGEGARREPTVRAPMVPLTQGLVANSQNCWPSLEFDLGRVFDYSHALWPAGFYNKTFKWPNWHTWESLIRHTAGMGRPLTEPDPDRYEHVNAHCDLLVCGGGPAGLMAALIAGRAGLRVVLADQGEVLGGSLNWEHCSLDGNTGKDWLRNTVTELESLGNVILLPRSTALGCYDHNVTTLLQRSHGENWRECFWTVRPLRVLLAAGAIEQGMIFRHNDRPGIMLAGAARHYLNRYAVVPGRQVVIATNNDSAYQTAMDLRQQGISVACIVERRPVVSENVRSRMQSLGIEIMTECRIAGTNGDRALSEVRIEKLDGRSRGREKCDLLAVSGGWSPRIHLYSHARGSLKFDAVSQCFRPDQPPSGFSVVGSANGTASLADCLAEAAVAAERISAELGVKIHRSAVPVVEQSPLPATEVVSLPLDTGKSRQWIDLAHDVTLGDAELAVREGYVSVEHFKRYTTTGMSVDQGKTGNLNAFIALGGLTGREIGEVGTTTFRPPYTPVTLGAIAGPHLGEFYAPRRFLPAHQAHLALNGHFEDFAGWQRPECYPRANESAEDAVQREVLAVRNAVGIFDNSPIGKIKVRGPDAAEFLNRLYVNQVLTLKPGRIRYGLMLNENGIIIDDGVFARVADDEFLVNTTSGGVGRVAEMMEEWLQCEWTGLQVLVDDCTTQWANFTIAGPHARDLIRKLDTDIDFSAEALPHMACVSGQVMGLEVHVMRVSFSGELSFEINLPARLAEHFLRRVLEAGEEFGITPYGVETLMVLRTEKGYLHLGSDTDGATTPDDVGWGAVARNKKTDFIGRRSLQRSANLDPARQQLVGLQPLDPGQAIRPGGHLKIAEGEANKAASNGSGSIIPGSINPSSSNPGSINPGSDGWVTSACFSPNLKSWIALGVLKGGRERVGQVVGVIDGAEHFEVRVVSPVFLDPANQRLNG